MHSTWAHVSTLDCEQHQLNGSAFWERRACMNTAVLRIRSHLQTPNQMDNVAIEVIYGGDPVSENMTVEVPCRLQRTVGEP